MNHLERKKHWEDIYEHKALTEVSWYQPTPATSLGMIQQFGISQESKIIDIGGGDSFLVDHLLDLGYENVTVLDISEKAIERAKSRLGARALDVKWVVADVTDFKPKEQYDLWHDRAAFHFLTQEEDIAVYMNVVSQSVRKGAYLVIGTFSENGPKKCSGIEIRQYSEQSMTTQMQSHFEKLGCLTVDHQTPFETTQQFLFCSFQRL